MEVEQTKENEEQQIAQHVKRLSENFKRIRQETGLRRFERDRAELLLLSRKATCVRSCSTSKDNKTNSLRR